MTLKGSRTVATGGVGKRAFQVPRSAPTHYNFACRMPAYGRRYRAHDNALIGLRLL
jgi:hypothetical protein